MRLILDHAHELYMLARIEELEALHRVGDATYTDTFELNELLIRYAHAWRVFEGGGQTTVLTFVPIEVIEGLGEESA